jgi:multisubunit Na+/H+ antiporter MnhG subunit
MRPSLAGLIVGALLILLSLILWIKNYNTLRSRDTIFVALLFSIAVSAHALVHAHQERWGTPKWATRAPM